MEFERGDLEQYEVSPWEWGENLGLFIGAEKDLKSYFESNLDFANLVFKKINDGIANIWIIGGVANPNKFKDREEDDIDILIEVPDQDELSGMNKRIGDGELVHLLGGKLKRDKWRVEITDIFKTWLYPNSKDVVEFWRRNLEGIY